MMSTDPFLRLYNYTLQGIYIICILLLEKQELVIQLAVCHIVSFSLKCTEEKY